MIIPNDGFYAQPTGTRWIAYVRAYRAPADARQVLHDSLEVHETVLFAAPAGQSDDAAVLTHIAALGLTPQDVVPVSHTVGTRPGPIGSPTHWRTVDRLKTADSRGPSVAEINAALHDLGVTPDAWYGMSEPTRPIKQRLARLIGDAR
jgi:hypothetical protein